MEFQNESEVPVSKYQEEVRMCVQSVIVNNNIINSSIIVNSLVNS